MYKVKYVDYFDVLGNEDDGYEVNNLCNLFEDKLKYIGDDDLFNFLMDKGYFKHNVTPSMLEFVDYYPYIEIQDAETNCPIGRFEIEEE